MINTIFRYLKENMTTAVLWLITGLSWILYILGVHRAGNWLLVCFITLFVLIMIIGQLKDKIKELQKELDNYKI
jgi:uncharacterized membrane protein